VVVNYFNLFGGFIPGETDPVLFIDSNRVLAASLTSQRLKAIAWGSAERFQSCG
jgi:hypothetical protein